MNLSEYMSDDVFLEKIIEFSEYAKYLVFYGKRLLEEEGRPFACFKPHIDSLAIAVDKELDVFRSNYDTRSTIFVLDIERYSYKYRNKFCEDQGTTYYSLEPLHQIFMHIFRNKFYMDVMAHATTQGYQYLWCVEEGTPEHDELVRIGRGGLRPDVEWHYDHPPFNTPAPWPRSQRTDRVPHYKGAAHNATGKILQFIVHRAIKYAHDIDYPLPIHIGDVMTWEPDIDGVNADLSCFEAPHHMRDFRAVGSSHQKMQVKEGGNPYVPLRASTLRECPAENDKVGGGFTLPLQDMFRLRNTPNPYGGLDYWDIRNYHDNIRMNIPKQNLATGFMMLQYHQSLEAEFFAGFDAADPYLSPKEYEVMDHMFPFNDFLNPTTIRQVVDVFYDGNPATARKIGTFIEAQYMKLHANDFRWHFYPPGYKAGIWAMMKCCRKHCAMFGDLPY